MDRMFEQMEKAALEWLEKRDPKEISCKAKVNFDGKDFRFLSLGQPITVSYPDYKITPQLSNWHHLIVLHYLNLADGTPLSGRPIGFGQYKSGMVRGGDFDRRAELIFRDFQLENLRKRCMELGGVEKSAKADLCVELSFMLCYPVTVNFWQADEEFPASGRLMVDGSAEHYLTIEDAVTVGELILEELRKEKGHGF